MRLPLLVAFLVAFSTASSSAGEPNLRSLLPEKPAVVVELFEPARIYSHPVVRGVWDALARSAEIQRRIDAPEFDRVRQVRTLLETAGDGDWTATVAHLTAGGVALSVTGAPGTPAEVTLVLSADDEVLLRKTVDASVKLALNRVPAERRPAKLPTETYQNVECVRLGDGGYALLGKTLIAASRMEALRGAIDRAHSAATPPPTAVARNSLARVELDLAAVRNVPAVAKGLTLPADDIGLVFFFGGWIDLLKRAGTVTTEITLQEKSIDVDVRLPADRNGILPGLAGFFASQPEARALPPLRVPGLIASASWYRDYAQLWQGRGSVLNEEARKRLEEGDDKAAKQLEVVGARNAPSEFFAGIGPHYRIVAARQSQSVYHIELPDRLPAAALVVELRTDDTRQKLQPVLKFLGLIGSAVNNRMALHSIKHKGFELASLRSHEEEDAQYKINRVRYQFSPTWGFAHGHFLVGSTTEIVCQSIDALDAERSQPRETLAEFTTGVQLLSAKEAAAALGDYRTTLVDATVLNDGLSRSEAGDELDVVRRAIEALGTISLRSGWTAQGFELHLNLGESKESSRGTP